MSWRLRIPFPLFSLYLFIACQSENVSIDLLYSLFIVVDVARIRVRRGLCQALLWMLSPGTFPVCHLSARWKVCV